VSETAAWGLGAMHLTVTGAETECAASEGTSGRQFFAIRYSVLVSPMMGLSIRALLSSICRRDEGSAAPVSEAAPTYLLQRSLPILLLIESLYVDGAPLKPRGATEGALGAIIAERVNLSK
jgi:hypothetical protein